MPGRNPGASPCVAVRHTNTIIPDPYNPLDWDRYSYARNNPLRYTDPSGHWPDWLDNALDYAQGAAYQFANDMSLGTVDRIATAFNLCMDCNRSDAYKQGEKLGRDASIVVASNEQVLGGATTASALAAGTSTAGPAIVCTVVTGGVCAVPSGGVIAVEAVAAATGGLIYANGSAVIAYAKSNSVSGNYKFPNANEIAKRLGVNENTFHRQIKPDILGDPEIAQLAKKIGATNPAIGIDKSGNIVLRNPNTGKTISTNIPLSSFGNQK